MELEQIISKIVEKEWPMFHSVNGENRVDCQEDRATFDAMRRAQFAAWSPEAAGSYRMDLERAEAEGRNLVREKYIHMMKTTDPKGYETFQKELPPVSGEKATLVDKIWNHLLTQTEKMREKYPAVSLGGRPLRSGEEGESGGWASIETYQTGELMTYSEETLRLLLEHIETLEKKGIDLAYEIQLNSVKCMGYQTMEEAERDIAFRFIQQMGGGECTTCGAYEDRTVI